MPVSYTHLVKEADEVVFYVTADTDYKMNFAPDFTDPKTYVGVNPLEMCIRDSSAPFYIRVGGNTGFTRQYVESFLCRDGKPIYATDQYKGCLLYTSEAALLPVVYDKQLFLLKPRNSQLFPYSSF